MTGFYVFRGKKVLWNLFILVVLILALVYVFRGGPESEPGEIAISGGQASEGLVIVEPVTVRTVPTKFSEYKLERERIRSRQMEFLQSVAYDARESPERRGEVQKDLEGFIAKMGRETEIENLLKAKGYLDALVILDKDSVTIVVPVTLTRDEAAQIGELVYRMTGIELEQITIVDEYICV